MNEWRSVEQPFVSSEPPTIRPALTAPFELHGQSTDEHRVSILGASTEGGYTPFQRTIRTLAGHPTARLDSEEIRGVSSHVYGPPNAGSDVDLPAVTGIPMGGAQMTILVSSHHSHFRSTAAHMHLRRSTVPPITGNRWIGVSANGAKMHVEA